MMICTVQHRLLIARDLQMTKKLASQAAHQVRKTGLEAVVVGAGEEGAAAGAAVRSLPQVR